MRKATKGWLIAATALTLAGCILFAGVMTTMGWNFSKLSTETYQTTEHTFTQRYRHIAVDIDTADVTFAPSENGETTVVCHESTKAAFAVTVENDTLRITMKDTRKWYERIAIVSDETTLTVYLPQSDYGKLSVHVTTGDTAIPAAFTFDSIAIDTTTGDVACGAATNGDITLTLTTGDINLSGVDCAGDITMKSTTCSATLTGVRCANLKSYGSTGDLTLTDVIASLSFDLKRTTGDIIFDGCDAAAITAKTTTGDITGNLLSDKVFTAKTTTGDVVVPASAGDEKCTLSATTGDITLTIKAH